MGRGQETKTKTDRQTDRWEREIRTLWHEGERWEEVSPLRCKDGTHNEKKEG